MKIKKKKQHIPFLEEQRTYAYRGLQRRIVLRCSGRKIGFVSKLHWASATEQVSYWIFSQAKTNLLYNYIKGPGRGFSQCSERQYLVRYVKLSISLQLPAEQNPRTICLLIEKSQPHFLKILRIKYVQQAWCTQEKEVSSHTAHGGTTPLFQVVLFQGNLFVQETLVD